VRAQETGAVITVEDNGAGVSDEVLPHLFEPFYRSDLARAREGGPGLGLTATASIVTLHAGTVVAERGPGGGLRVTVTLPAAAASLGHGRHGEGAAAGWVGNSSDQGEG
jgi:signal transduction histidine kinase